MRHLFHTLAIAILLCTSARADLPGYVARKDPSYTWSRIGGSRPGESPEYAELYMVSQTWHNIAWKHKLIIVRPPATEKATHALLLISGGSWRDGQENRRINPNSGELKIAQAIATQTRMPIAVLQHVPFQPIFGGLVEDQIISHTFDQYLNGGDDDWPLLLPMTKAAVRAMDTVQEFARKEWRMDITGFIVTGASKRGWTTWLTGAADGRVAAIAPMVIDVLNMGPQMKHQIENYGAYSDQLADYTRLKIQDRMDTPAGRKLLEIVDPYSYRDRLRMPKLILLGTNDPYWTLDSLNLYYDGLAGEKYILYVPNAGHGLNDMVRVVSDVVAMTLKASGKLEFPKMTWDFKEDGQSLRLAMRSNTKPATVSAWMAESDTKDFRRSKWTSQPMAADGNEYVFEMKASPTKHSAAFGEAMYEIDGHKLYLSTTIRMILPQMNGAK